MLTGVFATSYKQDMAIVRTKTQWFLLVLSLVLVFTIPLYCNTYWLSWFNFLFIWVIAVLGLHILTGLSGLVSVAQASFMGVGAYVTGVLTMKLEWSCWVTLPLAGIGAGLVALIFCVPSLRIKGFQFAMATLAASFIIAWVVNYLEEWTGGVRGMYVEAAKIGGMALDKSSSQFYVAAILAVLAILLATNVARTRTGRALIAIRDSELAAQVMGVNLLRYKTIAVFIGGFYAGIAGWLWAHQVMFITVDHFGLITSIWMLGVLVIGGVGSTAGAVAGTLLLRLVDRMSEYAIPALTSAFPSIGYFFAASLGTVLYSLVIILFITFQPRGLYHWWQAFKASYRLFPYSY